MTERRTANAAFNHVALSVEDLEKAVEWYTRHFGFRELATRKTWSRAEEPHQTVFRFYGSSLQEVRVAWLAMGNGVGLELFQFIDPPPQGKKFTPEEFDMEKEYRRYGFFHICLTVPDPLAKLNECSEDGAKSIGEPLDGFEIPGFNEAVLYMHDPWGNVIELLSCSFEQLLANRG